MPDVTVKIKGLEEIKRRINRFPEISGKHVAQAINESVLAIESKAKPITPVAQGILVGSYAFGRVRATQTSLRGVVNPTTPYAAEVHDLYPPGTPYKRPTKNPRALAGFLEVGKDAAQNQVDRFFAAALRSITKDLATD